MEQNQSEMQIYVNPLVTSLKAGVTQAGGIEVARIDKVGVNLELRKYKNENGSTNYPELFSIPNERRISAMAKQDLGQTIKMIAVALTLCFETMNLTRPMQAFQILDLAEMIVDESESDKLAFEDLMIFLQRLTRGEYPGLYEGMDIPKFMERFGIYRDERWNEGVRLRDEKHEEYKRMGDDNIFERTTGREADTLDMQLGHWKQKAIARKDERELNKRYK